MKNKNLNFLHICKILKKNFSEIFFFYFYSRINSILDANTTYEILRVLYFKSKIILFIFDSHFKDLYIIYSI